MNFLEVLATPYFIVEPPYAEMMNELRKRSNEVAHYYERGFYLCTCGLFNKLDTDFQKGRVDKKKFTFGLYLRDFVNKYSNGTEFKDCFESENKDFYTSVRLSDSDNFVERYNCKGDYHELWYEAKADMREYFNKAQYMSQIKNDNIATNLPQITELLQLAMLRKAQNQDTREIENKLTELGIGKDTDNKTKE